MRRVVLENRMVERLLALDLEPGPRVLVPPVGCHNPDALAELMIQETVGWYETELDVLHRLRTEVETELAEASEGLPVEYDERTGEPEPVLSPEAIVLRREAWTLTDRQRELQAGLTRAKAEATAEQVRQVLHEFQFETDLQAARRLADDGLHVVVSAGGYGLGANRQERLQLRRWFLDLPDERDWE